MALPGWNQAEIDKADRYVAWCKSHDYDTRKFRKLCDQALDRDDWRVVNMIYVRDEFETRQRSADDEWRDACPRCGATPDDDCGSPSNCYDDDPCARLPKHSGVQPGRPTLPPPRDFER